MSEIDDIALSPDQRWSANGSRDHTIRVRSIEGWHEVYRIRTKGWGTNVEFSPDGRFLAYADSEGELAIVETGTWREVVRRKAKSNFSPDALRFSPDGLSIVSGHSDSIIRIWDVQTLSLKGELKGHMRTVLRLAIHPDGKTLASVSADATVRLWNLPTRTLLGTLDTFEQTPWDCRFSAAGNQLAVMTRLDDDATCHLWRVLEAE